VRDESATRCNPDRGIVALQSNGQSLLCDIVRNKFFLRRKYHMKNLIRMGLFALLASGLLAVCSSSAAAQDAAATYKAKCAMCHGADGKGGKMGTKDFASPEIKSQSDAQLAETITKGKPPKMPAYGEKLKDTEIKDLVTYIRTLGK
jgi:cytochrome c6